MPRTPPASSCRTAIQIIGGGLERITINLEEVQPVFDEVNGTLTEEAQPVKESLEAL